MTRTCSLAVSLALVLLAVSGASAGPVPPGGNGPPDILEIGWDIDYGGTIFDPAPVAHFEGTAIDPDGVGDIIAIAWDFEYDGSVFDPDPSAGGSLTPSHAYSTPGTYVIALQVTDSAGNTDLAQISLTIAEPSSLVLLAIGLGLLAALGTVGRFAT